MIDTKCNFLLIDDDETAVYCSTFVLEYTMPESKINVATNGLKALDYLNNCIKEGSAFPDVILVDLNMPVMDGFEFLQEFSSLDRETTKNTVIYTLSSSSLQDDKRRVANFDIVEGYLLKPLDEQTLRQIYLQREGVKTNRYVNQLIPAA